MISDETLFKTLTFSLWASISIGLWVGGPGMVNKMLGFTPDLIPFILISSVLALVTALVVCFLVALGIFFTEKQRTRSRDQAGRVATLYSSLTGNDKPVPVEYDYFYEPSPTKPSEIYREYKTMRAALASHVRAGDDAMTKARQLNRYTELGGIQKDYLYQSPGQLRKLRNKSTSKKFLSEIPK